MVAMVVAKLAAPAIMVVLFLPILITNSTNTMVNIVFRICSTDWDLAVAEKFCLPLKYPLITAVMETKNIEGERAIKEYSASGICIQFVAICLAPKKSKVEPVIPIMANVIKAILKILWAPLLSPIAILSETSLEMAFGTPVEEKVNSKA